MGKRLYLGKTEKFLRYGIALTAVGFGVFMGLRSIVSIQNATDVPLAVGACAFWGVVVGILLFKFFWAPLLEHIIFALGGGGRKLRSAPPPYAKLEGLLRNQCFDELEPLLQTYLAQRPADPRLNLLQFNLSADGRKDCASAWQCGLAFCRNCRFMGQQDEDAVELFLRTADLAAQLHTERELLPIFESAATATALQGHQRQLLNSRLNALLAAVQV